MGTETKFTCYKDNCSTSTGSSGIPKLIKSKKTNSTKGKQCTNISLNNGHLTINGKEQKQGQVKNTSTENGDSHLQKLNGDTNKKSSVPFVPIHIDENNVIDGAREILKVIRPSWDLNAVEFKKFTDGITNKLVGCFYTQPLTPLPNGSNSNSNSTPINGTSIHVQNGDNNDDSGNLSDEEDADNESEEDISATPSDTESPSSHVVLVRVYGNKTDLLIDRKAEKRNIELLHSYGFAPSLYATFKNGLAYDYVPGNTLNTKIVLQPEVWQLVARRMAEMHRVVDDRDNRSGDQPVPMLWKKTQSFFDLVPEKFSDADKHKRLEGTFLPIAKLRKEFTELYRRLEALGSPLVFAHNDLLLGNVVYTESMKTVNFIDYEYADYNFQAFDIGNHFAEFAGVDEVDYTRYPNRDFQMEWLRVYLQAYLQRDDVTDDEVERLYVQVNQFALAAHFFWTIWSLIQAEHSKIDFDYVDYAFVRYNEYLAKKDEFLALNDSKDSC